MLWMRAEHWIAGPFVRCWLSGSANWRPADLGSTPSIAEQLVELINSDVVPEIREFGGIGTADLQALAGTALTLLGERQPLGGGNVPVRLTAWATADALPFISSSALTIGQAILAQQKLSSLLDNAASSAALSFIAMSGNSEA